MATAKYSRQREAIRQYLASTKEHPTADMVYQAIRAEFPNISLGTVYRNLSLLAQKGEIQKISCGNGTDRFDWNTSDHCHFMCKGCGCVMDLDMESISHINTIAASHFDGEIQGNITYFFGKCKKCKEEEDG